jgi:hypothetical protein
MHARRGLVPAALSDSKESTVNGHLDEVDRFSRRVTARPIVTIPGDVDGASLVVHTPTRSA